MEFFDRYTDLTAWLEGKGHKLNVLGCAPDGSPIVCFKVGGEKHPSIFISAGSHSTEQAGIGAAAMLGEQINTDHQVYVIPSRDPIGMNGFAYALGLSLGKEPNLGSIEDIEGLLKVEGEVIFEEDDTVLAIIGEYGYSTRGLYGKFKGGEDFLEPLKGRRIFFPSRDAGVEGTAPFQRAYTLIVSPEGEVLHINRFHDTPWAPVEAYCTRRLMSDIQPGLTLDLHEYRGDAFWFSARHQQCEEDEIWEQRMADAMIKAVIESGTERAPEHFLPGAFFEKGERGVFWLISEKRGEGLNLADFAATEYGPSFTIETGMQSTYQKRVNTACLVAQTAVTVFQERFA